MNRRESDNRDGSTLLAPVHVNCLTIRRPFSVMIHTQVMRSPLGDLRRGAGPRRTQGSERSGIWQVRGVASTPRIYGQADAGTILLSGALESDGEVVDSRIKARHFVRPHGLRGQATKATHLRWIALFQTATRPGRKRMTTWNKTFDVVAPHFPWLSVVFRLSSGPTMRTQAAGFGLADRNAVLRSLRLSGSGHTTTL